MAFVTGFIRIVGWGYQYWVWLLSLLLVKAGPLFANCCYFVPVFGLLLSVFFMGMPITLFQVLSIPLCYLAFSFKFKIRLNNFLQLMNCRFILFRCILETIYKIAP